MKIHITRILEELAKLYGKGRDADLARQLGIPPQTLYNWKARGTVDYELVYAQCKEVNPHWLLTGEGPMLKSMASGGSGNVSEAEMSYNAPPADSKVAIQALQKVIAILERDNARMVAELEEMKANQKAALWEMQSKLDAPKKVVTTK